MDIFLTGNDRIDGVVIKNVKCYSNTEKFYELIGTNVRIPLLKDALMFGIDGYWNDKNIHESEDK